MLRGLRSFHFGFLCAFISSLYHSWQYTWSCRHSTLGADECFGLYCIFDGHNGVAAAQHIHDTLEDVSALLHRHLS
jgi:hypothetical protein